jgi:hypothetical protein
MAAILDFLLPAACRIISVKTDGMADPENMGIAVVTAIISSLIAEISVLPVYRPPY